MEQGNQLALSSTPDVWFGSLVSPKVPGMQFLSANVDEVISGGPLGSLVTGKSAACLYVKFSDYYVSNIPLLPPTHSVPV